MRHAAVASAMYFQNFYCGMVKIIEFQYQNAMCRKKKNQSKIMLAERKSKEKWSQDPRNTFWSRGTYTSRSIVRVLFVIVLHVHRQVQVWLANARENGLE